MKCNAGEITIERTGRNVIKNKLLTALEDDSVVAVLLTKKDCEVLMAALSLSTNPYWTEFREGLEKLKSSAFK